MLVGLGPIEPGSNPGRPTTSLLRTHRDPRNRGRTCTPLPPSEVARQTSLRSNEAPPFGSMAVRSGTKEELFDSPIKSEEPPADEESVKKDMSFWTEDE